MLEICISTYGERVNRLANLPTFPNCRYLIIHQAYNQTKLTNCLIERFSKGDISLIKSDTFGLAKSRNEAVKHSTGKLLLISDDDVLYSSDLVHKIISSKEKFDFDIALFKASISNDDSDFRVYPNQTKKLGRVDCLHACSIEMVLDRRIIEHNQELFNINFGIGSEFVCGEESILLFDMFRKKRNLYFINEYIVSHPKESTATRSINVDEVLKAKGAVYRYGFGYFVGFILILRLAFLNSMPAILLQTKINCFRKLSVGFFLMKKIID